ARFAAAAKACRKLVRSEPRGADIWHLLAASLLQDADPQAARDASLTALRLAPGHPEYRNTHALVLEGCGEGDAAVALLEALVAADPGHADACYNLGRLLLTRGEPEAALVHLERALVARPGWAAACKNLGLARFAANDAPAARAALLEALRLDPHDNEVCINLARLCAQDDDFEQALHYYRLALESAADAATLLRFALLRPIFCADAAEIAAHRARIERNLAMLEQAPPALVNPAVMVGPPLFYFAYHGLDDRPLSERVGRIMQHGWRVPPRPAPALAVRPRRRPRIAFVSAHFKQHTIGRLYAPLIERLPRDDFEIAVLGIGCGDDPTATRIRPAADLALDVPAAHAPARGALAALDADVVFFPDVGMEAVSYWLAAERFAPVQALSWGHPVTSGLATLDYFLSSSFIEPPDAAAHYSETLVELPAWPVLYDNPGAPATAAIDRDALGLTTRGHLYLCAQSLFKLHPDFDAYLGAILARDARACIALLGGRASWEDKLMRRFQARFGAAAQRIRFLPRQSAAAFYALLAQADVVLDTVHFSGGMTSFEAVWAGTPFVTERGAFMRGRDTAGLCDLLGLD
ncbi:MAG: tetratricopeptide repeat protein, partial [Gammaproteobacteria bacterium]